jgi:hypothetical protein
MPTRRWLVVGLPVALAGCSTVAIKPPPDTAMIPAWAEPIWPGDFDAILHAQWAWADPSRTHGLPAQGAQAVAEIDYLAGMLSTNPQWLALSPFAKMRMLQARADVRAALGIAPDAPSQTVVDAMLATQAALDAGDQQAALGYLSAPIFSLGPEQTLARLAALPYVETANIGTAMTANSPLMS